jgi:hypothetical protein
LFKPFYTTFFLLSLTYFVTTHVSTFINTMFNIQSSILNGTSMVILNILVLHEIVFF